MATSSTGRRSGESVLGNLDDGVLTLTLNRPDSLNAVDADMLDDLADQVAGAGSDPDTRVIVLRGAGRAFCSGADIGADDQREGPPVATIDAGNRLVAAVRDVPRPVVSVVQGPCAGIGVSVALSADLTLASSKAFFMLAFTKIGLMPDGGASALVAASTGRAKAMRMALLAERLTAEEAEAVGLVSHLLPVDSLDDEVDTVVDTLRTGPSVAFARTKEAVNAATLGALEPAFVLERAGQADLLMAPDFAEGTAAFNEKRTPTFSDTTDP